MEKNKRTSSPEEFMQDVDAFPSFLRSSDAAPLISQIDWQLTPKAVRAFILYMHSQCEELKHRVDQLEVRLNRDSGNSNQPPCSDTPYSKSSGKKKRKSGAKKGHKGHRQELLEPTETLPIMPEQCPWCGNTDFPDTNVYHIHQQIELPEIKMDVIHFALHQGRCPRCNKLVKAKVPQEHQSGYGPRLCALIGEMAGNHGSSRSVILSFCASVLDFKISKGAIQKVIDRVCEAIRPHYEAIARVARKSKVNYIDETSWFTGGILMWLWAMVSTKVAFFMVHAHRSKDAFAELIEDWQGILVSDGYGVYCRWVDLRQTCLAHLIRTAKGLSQRKDPQIARFGEKALAELQRLCSMAHAPPNLGEWQTFYARLSHLISQNHDRKDDAGKFARRLLKEMYSLWVFLEEHGVEPTNNRAERALRFGVIWRKRSQGTDSDKGNRWVERILSLKQTCSLQSMPTYPVLVDALQSFFKNQAPDIDWIDQLAE